MRNGFERRLENLEAAIKGQETKPRPDWTRLTAEELRDMEALEVKAGSRDGDKWNLSALTTEDLHTLRVLLQKAYQMEDTAL
jgi:hypothetical protein